jgi:hypothetical protein
MRLRAEQRPTECGGGRGTARSLLVEAAWRREVILYFGDDFEQAHPVRQELGRLCGSIASFFGRTSMGGSSGSCMATRVHGIDGGDDLDVMRASP